MIYASVILLSARNIVSTVNLDCKLDLKAIALQARNAEYNPKVYFCVVVVIVVGDTDKILDLLNAHSGCVLSDM